MNNNFGICVPDKCPEGMPDYREQMVDMVQIADWIVELVFRKIEEDPRYKKMMSEKRE